MFAVFKILTMMYLKLSPLMSGPMDGMRLPVYIIGSYRGYSCARCARVVIDSISIRVTQRDVSRVLASLLEPPEREYSY